MKRGHNTCPGFKDRDTEVWGEGACREDIQRTQVSETETERGRGGGGGGAERTYHVPRYP